MERITRFTLKHKGLVTALFVVFAIIGLMASQKVHVNYNMIDYLPETAPSTVALQTMNDAFTKPVSNLRVMVPDVSIPEALEYKDQLGQVQGVQVINWLDDFADSKIPLEMQDEELVSGWYTDGNALFSLTIDQENQKETLAAIRDIVGEQGAISGNPIDAVYSQQSINAEVRSILLLILPAVLLILLFTSKSWIEPFIVMANLGVAVALNLGTNLFLGEISFVTRTTAIVLQLACSIDYSIFLIDHFKELRSEMDSPYEAMVKAVKESVTSILSSGMTTVIGFLALIAMQFKIGPDMGVVLAKGIVFSLITTLLFLPSLLLFSYKLIDKTSHRSFLPSFKALSKGAYRIKGVVAALVIVMLVPAYLAGQNIHFLYGMSKMSSPDSQVRVDRQRINDVFGESATFALLVPSADAGGSLAIESKMIQTLHEIPQVTNVVSFTETIGATIPSQFVPPDKLELFYSNGYSRIIVNVAIPPESAESFALVETLRGTAGDFYGDDYHLAGEIANVYDMKHTITHDSTFVNLLSIGGIALVLFITFQSFSLPLILLLTIQSSIFINIAVPYFMQEELNYIGYLIISSVQLGATVDYAILFAHTYMKNRSKLLKKQAIQQTIQDTAGSILTSGSILTVAGLVLGLVSTNSIISQLGILLARGAALSTVLVLTFLPALLSWGDTLIQKTTRKINFVNPEKKNKVKG